MQKIKKKNLLKKLSKNVGKWCAGLLGAIIVVIVSSMAWDFLKLAYENADFNQKRIAYERIEKLGTETNIGFFQDILGSPAFVNNMGEETKNKEYVFVDKFFYTQAIVDGDDVVLAYSITTRQSDFNPKLNILWGKPPVILGETKLVDLIQLVGADDPDHIISAWGVHDISYAEGYYFGNPGNYQTFFFGTTQAGYTEEELSLPPELVYSFDLKDKISVIMNPGATSTTSSGKRIPEDVREDLQEFREDTIINTYTIVGPLRPIKELLGQIDSALYVFGPDYNQVRLLFR